MHHTLQAAMLIFTLTLGKTQKFDALGRPKCCSNSLSPSLRQQQPWVDTLREATYQSIIRHLDFSGTLDGRLDRDHTLWQLLHEAKYFLKDHRNPKDEIKTGILVENLQNNKISFEFHQTDKSFSPCSSAPCNFKNESLVALWRLRRSENPYAMWIRVKLPKIKEHPTEDVYEYSINYGLKKLNPDPQQFNSFGSEKSHRFSIPFKEKSGFKSVERMDIPFQVPNKVFGFGRVTPTSFVYDQPIVSGKSEDGWIISSPRKPRPGVIIDTGIKSSNPSLPSDPLSGPFTASGPKGFRHVIHSLPSIPPPQNLDHPLQEIRGFLPSIGPINAPPPYKTEYVYDPRYVLYYNSRPNPPSRFSTQPPKHFKPSTEFVRYSEVDPFYHPNGERDVLSTSPLPFHNFHTTNFPKSINDQLPTYSPIENTRPPFQIIVSDIKPTLRTTTQKPKKVLSTTERPRNRFFPKPLTKTPERTKTSERDKVTTKAFGEKIKPKTSSTPLTSTQTNEKPITKFVSEISNKDIIKTSGRFASNKTRNNTKATNFIIQPLNLKGTTGQEENVNTTASMEHDTNATPSLEVTETTDAVTETTIEKNGMTTAQEESTENNNEEGNITEQNVQTISEDMTNTYKTTVKATEITVLGLHPTESTLTNNTPDLETKISETDETTQDYYNDEITEANNETTTKNGFNNNSGISDFFSTLTDTLFSMQTTTEKNYEKTTIITTEKKSPENTDAETQESQQQNFRLLTIPGDSVSIVANRISKSISYRTAAGKEGQLKAKKHIESRYRFSDAYKDYSTIL